MLYRPKLLRLLPGYRALLRDGERADVVVVAAKMWWGTAGGAARNARLRLDVHLPGGGRRTIDRVERYRDLHDRSIVGSILPVRVRGDRIEVDLPELRRRYRADKAKLERRAIRAAEAELRRKNKP